MQRHSLFKTKQKKSKRFVRKDECSIHRSHELKNPFPFVSSTTEIFQQSHAIAHKRMKSFLRNQPVIPGSSRPKIASNSKSCNPAICLAFFKLSLSLSLSCNHSNVIERWLPVWTEKRRVKIVHSFADHRFVPSLDCGRDFSSRTNGTIVSRWLADDAISRDGRVARCLTVVAVCNVTDEVIHHI